MIRNRILFALAVCLCVISCDTLEIAMVTRDDDGDRIMLTSDTRVCRDTYFALGAKYNENDTVLAVLVTYDGRSDHGVFAKGDKMMVRLTDQSVITLVNVYSNEFEKETVTNTTRDYVSDFGYAYSYDPVFDNVYVTPYEISRFVPRVTTSQITKSYALYFISKSQLNDIIEKGVIKFRIEFENSELDLPDTTKLPAIFANMRTVLYNGVYKGVQRTEF